MAKATKSTGSKSKSKKGKNLPAKSAKQSLKVHKKRKGSSDEYLPKPPISKRNK